MRALTVHIFLLMAVASAVPSWAAELPGGRRIPASVGFMNVPGSPVLANVPMPEVVESPITGGPYSETAEPKAVITEVPASDLKTLPGVIEAPVAPPAPRVEITVTGSALTVRLEDAEVAPVMKEIARQAGFEVSVNEDIGKLTVTTSFTGMDVERGIARVFQLVNHKNYLLEYDASGRIQSLIVMSGPGGAKVKTQSATSARPAATTAPRTPARRAAPSRRPAATTETPQAGPDAPSITPIMPDQLDLPAGEEPSSSDDMPEAPFMPPASGPRYIPPSERN